MSSRRRKRRPTSAKPRRNGPSRTRDNLRSTVDRSRQEELQHRVRQGMFSKPTANQQIQTIGYENHPYAEQQSNSNGMKKKNSRVRYRPSSASSSRNAAGNSRRRRPLSARQERPISPQANQERRLSPIASFRNMNGREYEHEHENNGDELEYDFDDTVERRPIRTTSRKRKGGKRRKRASTAGRSRKKRGASSMSRTAPLRRSRGAAESILGDGTRDNSRSGNSNGTHGANGTNGATSSNIAGLHNSQFSGNKDDSALARSEDLLARARQYLLNRAGYLNTNTRRFLDDDEEQQTRATQRRSTSSRQRATSAGRKRQSKRQRK